MKSRSDEEVRKESVNEQDSELKLDDEFRMAMLRQLWVWLKGLSIVVVAVIGGFWAVLVFYAPDRAENLANKAVDDALVKLEIKLTDFERNFNNAREDLKSDFDNLTKEFSVLRTIAVESAANMKATEIQAERSATAVDAILKRSKDRLSTGEVYVEALEKASREIDTLATNRNFQENVANLIPAFPSGAIVAFDLQDTDKTPGGCPEGWVPFVDGKGKVIIGAGIGQGKLEIKESKNSIITNTLELSERKYGSQGGEEAHKLTPEEMPKHSHAYNDYYYYDEVIGDKKYQTKKGDGAGTRNDDSRITGDEGEGLPHNNMMPFIALHLCKKL